MRRLPLLVVLLTLLAGSTLAAAGTVDLLDPQLTVGSVTVRPDPEGEARTRAFDAGPSRDGKEEASERHAGLKMRTPDAADPALDALANAPFIQVTFGEVEYLLAPRGVPTKPMHLLLAGSDLAIPMQTRELAAAPRALPLAPAPLEPLSSGALDASRETSRAAGASHGAAGEPQAATASDVEGAQPPTTPTWPERAALAGAAAILLLTPFALYHRLRGKTLLGHESRSKIVDLLRTRPGLTPAEAARELRVDPSTALYHLRRLVKEGIATTDGERRGARYFAVGSVAPQDRTRVVFERESADLLEAIRAEPGTSKTTLAGRLAIARATLHWHLSRLERAGLVRCERAGREVRVFPSQETFSPGPA